MNKRPAKPMHAAPSVRVTAVRCQKALFFAMRTNDKSGSLIMLAVTSFLDINIALAGVFIA
jgi:hypothetical protein